MLITTRDRVRLLELIGRGGTVAEIGVYRGGFASTILQVVQPIRLHLIDPWARDEREAPETARVGGGYPLAAMIQAFDTVQERFSSEIASGQVVMHREYSVPAAAQFPDHAFDWIYIDGMHDYENVLADLRAYADKVKDEGFILGHDFSNTARGRVKRTGVIPAVREFIAAGAFELVAMTNEAAPSYVLARKGNNTTLLALRQALVTGDHCIDIDESHLDTFTQVEVVHADGRKGQLLRFG